MFQRIKGAFDSIAEEQSRQRILQPPSRAPSARRSGAGAQSPSSRPVKARSGTADAPRDLSQPDPDPATFEADNELIASDTPRRSEDSSVGGSTIKVVVDKTENEAHEHGALAEPIDDGTSPTKEAAFQSEPSVEVQAKLRKLDKLETKYHELLRAYRKAHARNSLIEPFEATMREHTSTTSIADPSAFVEYLSQLNLKGDMVMGELKRVTVEKNAAKEKLQAAVEETKAAWDEVAQLRQDKDAATAMVSVANSDVRVSPDLDITLSKTGLEHRSENRDGATTASPLRDSSQAGIATLFATSTLATRDVAAPSSDERLEKKLHNASLQVERLENENTGLRKDLAKVQDEFERTSEVLRSAQNEVSQNKSVLETKQVVLKRTEQELELARHELEVVQKMSEDVKTELDSAKKDFEASSSNHHEIVVEKNNEIGMLERTTADLTARLSAITKQLNEQRVQFEKLQIDTEGVVQGRLREALIAEQPTMKATSPQESDLQKLSEGMDTAEEVHDATKKKKNKKKKKKGGAASAMSQDVSRPGSPVKSMLEADRTTTTTTINPIVDLQLRLETYSAEIIEKDASIHRLQTRIKAQDELVDEIEHLKDELLHIGQEHVEAKDRIMSLDAAKASLNEENRRLQKAMDGQQIAGVVQEVLRGEIAELKLKCEALEATKSELEKQVQSLERDIVSLGQSKASSDAALEEARQTLATELEELRSLNSTLEADLSASLQLAVARFKELTNVRELLQRIQAEYSTMKSELSALKSEKAELNVTIVELKNIEAKKADLQSELEATRRRMTERDQEYRSLDQRFNQESSRRSNLEESTRRMQKDLQRAETEKNEAVDVRSRTTAELKDVQNSANQSLSQVKRLEDQLEQLNKDSRTVREELDVQVARHAQAQNFLSGARDQAMEIATQMKEAKGRCDSLEEELTDAHRLLHERGRESETMRRLLAELEGRSESRLKEMKTQLDLATQERDRAEEEASSIGRRRGREVEEARNRLRDAERSLKSVLEDKSDLERVASDVRRRTEEAEQRAQSSVQELSDVRKAMEDLKDALEGGENQTRQLLKEKMDLTRCLEEAQVRVDRLQKSKEIASEELRTQRTLRTRHVESEAPSSRSSIESSLAGRVTSPTFGREPPRLMHGSAPTAQAIDYVYLKNVLLQFLEQKDKSHQMQLVPVLSLLLHFDKRDEQKWLTAISTR